MYNFILKRRPISYNSNKGPRKIQYGTDLTRAFTSQNPGAVKLQGKLYALIYYFFKIDLNLDADNLSKPVWDHLNNVTYTDDNQIKMRTSGSFNLATDDYNLINTTGLTGSMVVDLLDALDNENHVIYIEVGQYNNTMFKFNIE